MPGEVNEAGERSIGGFTLDEPKVAGAIVITAIGLVALLRKVTP